MFKIRAPNKQLLIRNDPEFMQFFKDHVSVDKTGKLTVTDCYAHLGFNLIWKGKPVTVTCANAVWFLTHGEWPKPGHHIDHINDDPMDNRPDNLQELTEAENHAKRRGRKVYRSYGQGKYGYGMGITLDRRDGKYGVDRNLSRGHGNGDLKGIRYSLGRYSSLEEAEKVVANHIEILKVKGLDYIPEDVKRKDMGTRVKADKNYQKMREMRASGMTFQQISDTLGVGFNTVYKRTKDVAKN